MFEQERTLHFNACDTAVSMMIVTTGDNHVTFGVTIFEDFLR